MVGIIEKILSKAKAKIAEAHWRDRRFDATIDVVWGHRATVNRRVYEFAGMSTDECTGYSTVRLIDVTTGEYFTMDTRSFELTAILHNPLTA